MKTKPLHCSKPGFCDFRSKGMCRDRRGTCATFERQGQDRAKKTVPR